MKRLCLGTFLKILKGTHKPSVKQCYLFMMLLKSVKDDNRFENADFQGALMSGRLNLIDYEKIISCNKNDLISYFKNKIEPCLDKDNQRLFIIAIREVLKEDNSIDWLDQIGFEDEGYTKQDILYSQIFPFAEFIANIYYFCVVNRQNNIYQKEIKEITSNYIESLRPLIENIQLESRPVHIYSKVSLTLEAKDFNEVFTEVKTQPISIPNSNHLKFYCLNVSSSKIDYSKLTKFIEKNIGKYIFSRAYRNNYKLRSDLGDITIAAFKAYKKRVKDEPTTSHFNEIMLYSFLECVLGAPKIFSKMELQDKSGTYESKTSGIHILTMKKNNYPFNQLVLGATDTINTLTDVVDKAFEQVNHINESINDELNFIDDTILNEEFDQETNKSLEEIILPSKNSDLSKPENAYGIFLGYTPEVDSNVINEEFKTNLLTKLQEDIVDIEPYITSKIKSLGLQNYSFYIYVLPFNDALIDSKEIIKEAMEV